MAKKHKVYLGHYLGIVIQNNDPQQRGRIKVWVPHLMATSYRGFVDTINDKKFKFVGNNINSSINDILDDLKKQLPWAECAAPITGEAASGRFNYFKNAGSISDTARLSTFEPGEKNTEYGNQNIDDIGEKPANIYESAEYRLHDAFYNPSTFNTNITNKYSYNYTPNSYSNKAKGSFGIPNVGSHVWCFFVEGDLMRPVYFAVAYGKEDWSGIYDTLNDVGDDSPGQDYPGFFENYTLSGKDVYDINVDTYRNKYVINQKGGTLEFVNTDNREVLKLTHYSGSFKEFNNYTNIELATQSDQKLVMQDQFLTVHGFKNLFVGRDYDNVVRGDLYRKIGNLNYLPHVQYKELLRELANLKQLFETQRTNSNKKGFINLTSPYQTKSGQNTKCPVCAGGSSIYYRLNNKFITATTGQTTSLINTPWSSNGLAAVIPRGSGKAAQAFKGSGGGQIFGETCPACNGSGISPSSQDGNFSPEPKKQQISKYIQENFNKFVDLEKQMGLGGSEIITITKNKIETIGMDINDLPSTRIDKTGKMSVNAVIVHKEGVFNCQQPSPVVEYVHVDDLPGGTFTQTIGNRYNLMVGAGGINFKSYGPVTFSGTITNIAGQQINIASENEVYIDGGQKLQIIADIINLKQRNGQQVVVEGNLGVTSNVVIGGGAHIEGELFVNHITGPTEIQETNRQTVTGTTNNVIPKIIGYNGLIGGGTDIIGYVIDPVSGILPVYASVTGTPGGPPAPIYSKTATGLMPEPDSVVVYSHSHTFKGIPTTCKDDNDQVRESAKLINHPAGQRVPAQPFINAKK
jgi:hypothetical protein